MSKIRRYIKTESNIFHQINANKNRQVRFYNCWKQDFDDMYWYRFLKAKGFLSEYPSLKYSIYGVFGPKRLIKYDNSDVRIFLATENVKRDNFVRYADHFLSSPHIDLAMGLEYFEHPKYIRFPLWMDYMFDPEYTREDILRKCAQLRYPKITDKNKFASLICSWDGFGISRHAMVQDLFLIGHVDCAGKFLHNDDSLKDKYADNKLNYIQNYFFNICPENYNFSGGVSEKIFEAIIAGCIPIYWGDYNHPEPEVLNQDAVIFWNKKDNQANIQKIEELYRSPKLMNEFLAQPRLKPTAEEYILDTFSSIEIKLRNIIAHK